MAAHIDLLGDGGRLTIEVAGYEREAAEDEDDADWLSSIISIQAGAFSGKFETSLRAYELDVLHEQLQAALQSLTGTVAFQTTEGDLSLEFAFGARGSVLITGAAEPHRFRTGALKFRIESDQSYVALALQEIKAILRLFPVRHAM